METAAPLPGPAPSPRKPLPGSSPAPRSFLGLGSPAGQKTASRRPAAHRWSKRSPRNAGSSKRRSAGPRKLAMEEEVRARAGPDGTRVLGWGPARPTSTGLSAQSFPSSRTWTDGVGAGWRSRLHPAKSIFSCVLGVFLPTGHSACHGSHWIDGETEALESWVTC